MIKTTLTYRQLAKLILDLPSDHIDDNVTIFDSVNGMYFPAMGYFVTEPPSDVLDGGCLVIAMQD